MDTNTLISSQLWKGNEWEIFKSAIREEIELILSKEIIDEFEEVLSRDYFIEKIKERNLNVDGIKANILRVVTLIKPTEKIEIIDKDPDDNKVLECALEGEAKYIVSGDIHLLNLKRFRGIEIVTSRRFLEILKSKPKKVSPKSKS